MSALRYEWVPKVGDPKPVTDKGRSRGGKEEGKVTSPTFLNLSGYTTRFRPFVSSATRGRSHLYPPLSTRDGSQVWWSVDTPSRTADLSSRKGPRTSGGKGGDVESMVKIKKKKDVITQPKLFQAPRINPHFLPPALLGRLTSVKLFPSKSGIEWYLPGRSSAARPERMSPWPSGGALPSSRAVLGRGGRLTPWGSPGSEEVPRRVHDSPLYPSPKTGDEPLRTGTSTSDPPRLLAAAPVPRSARFRGCGMIPPPPGHRGEGRGLSRVVTPVERRPWVLRARTRGVRSGSERTPLRRRSDRRGRREKSRNEPPFP